MPENTLYIGTYPRAYHSDTADAARGIHVLGDSQHPYAPVQMQEALRTGWLVLHPSGERLYALDEVKERDGKPGGSVTSYAVDPSTGRLTKLGHRRTAASPCHAALDPSSRLLVVATFHGGVVHAFPVEHDGTLGEETSRVAHRGSSVHPVRQLSPHPHGVAFDPTGRFVFVPDLGTDRVEVHGVEAENGLLTPDPAAGVALPAGSGPRHIVLHPTAPLAYVVNEMTATITTLSYDRLDGRLRVVDATSVLPEDAPGIRSAAEMLLHPTARWLYVTHRSHGSSGPRPDGGEDCIVRFRVDEATGRLHDARPVPSGGLIPRTAAFRAGGSELLVGHQGSGDLRGFDVDPDDGTLTPSGVVVSVPVPVCLVVT